MYINSENITIQEYWRRVLALAATLPDVVTVISTPDERLPEEQRGRVQASVVEAKIAAQLILARSHRLATEDEITAIEVKREIDIQELVRRRLAAQGIVAIQLSDKTSSE
jgi:hypothetical protein